MLGADIFGVVCQSADDDLRLSESDTTFHPFLLPARSFSCNHNLTRICFSLESAGCFIMRRLRGDMKLLKWYRRSAQALACFVFLSAFQAADAATQSGRVVVTDVKGIAEYQVRGEAAWHQARIGMVLAEGVSLKTGKASALDLAFTTGAIARMAAGTVVSVDKIAVEATGLPQSAVRPVGRTEVTLRQGRMMTEVAKQTPGSVFRVHTPEGDIDVQGTQLLFAYDPATGQFTLAVPEGSVTLTLPGGQTVTVTAGNQISGTFYPATGKVTVTQPTPAPMDPVFSQFLTDNTTSGIRQLVINSAGPVDIEAVIRAAIAAAGRTGNRTIVVIPNITNPTTVSPSVPAPY